MPIFRDGHSRFAPGPRRYAWLLKFGCVEEWGRHYPFRTRDEYLYLLGYFLERCKLGPDELLRLESRDAKRLHMKPARQEDIKDMEKPTGAENQFSLGV